ncbi:MAG TPA: ROK family transcriptional regulator [Thermotogota bacterium]|nr:ROK family transcriptional regulator [Thermotogota bacterium]HPJ89169.1 ROK family transcriptional regulator [Thermotogota bacterium]HPR95668.1 ROK family transcriptional regulator [Thermotogota bacterium]
MLNLKNPTQHQILNRIWIRDSFTRQLISNEMNVNRSTVSRAMEGLLEQEIIIRDGVQNPGETGGRKTEVLKLNEKKASVIGITVVNDRLFCVLTNFRGHLLHEDTFEVKINNGNIVDVIEACVKKLKEQFDHIMAVAISIPGIVDSEKGVIDYSFDLQIRDLELKRVIEKKTGIFTYVENDANAGAASYLHESSLVDRNLIYYMFSFPSGFRTYGGVGAGIVIDGKIYKGSRMAAGEIILDNSWKYSKELELHAMDLGRYEWPSDDFPELFKDMADNLINRITVVTTLLDPDRIVLGGDITDFSDSVIDYLKTEIFRGLPFRKKEQVIDENFIQIDHDGLKNLAYGGAVTILKNFFSDFDYAQKIIKFIKRRRK